MSSRIKEFLPEPSEPKGCGDYFAVCGLFGWFAVTAEVADHLTGEVEKRWRRRWVVFEDLFGSAVRVRVRDIHYIEECTVEQRKRQRALHAALAAERKEDRPFWDDD